MNQVWSVRCNCLTYEVEAFKHYADSEPTGPYDLIDDAQPGRAAAPTMDGILNGVPSRVGFAGLRPVGSAHGRMMHVHRVPRSRSVPSVTELRGRALTVGLS